MFARLQLPVSEFVAMQSQRLVRIPTRLASALRCSMVPDLISLQPLAKYCCSEDTTLAAAIKRMAKHGLHRLWIVGASLSSAYAAHVTLLHTLFP